MRLKNNPDAVPELNKSNYKLKLFPHEINEETIIEVGMGKGEMITQLAKANPELNYIGIEKYPTIAHKAMKRAEKLNINNFKIIVEDLKDVPALLNGKINTI